MYTGRMLQILCAYGIPEKLMQLAYFTRRVITPDGETDFFEMQAGVLQGDDDDDDDDDNNNNN